jgi:hypothetical protein
MRRARSVEVFVAGVSVLDQALLLSPSPAPPPLRARKALLGDIADCLRCVEASQCAKRPLRFPPVQRE